MKNVIIINGLPGSGKGTQAALLAEKFGYAHISSGQLIRDAINTGEKDTFTLGIIDRYKKGTVQPDDVANVLISQRIKELQDAKGIIFDSYPISVGQSDYLEKISSSNHLGQAIFILINVYPKSVLERLKTRKICSKCGQPVIDETDSLKECLKCGGRLIQRSDDDPKIVQRRIDGYLPLLKSQILYYKKRQRYFEVNGEGTIKEVAERIQQKIHD